MLKTLDCTGSAEIKFNIFCRDVLLLEAGFLCIVVAPFWHNSRKPTPSDSVTFIAVRWLLFRLLFSSGVIKLTSGCPLWWSLDGNFLKTITVVKLI